MIKIRASIRSRSRPESQEDNAVIENVISLSLFGEVGKSVAAVLISRARQYVSPRCWRRNGTRSCWSCSKRRRRFGGNTVAGEFARCSPWVERDEAICYAEAPRGLNDNPEIIARACEEVLLSLGRSAEAYERYAIAANRGASYVAAFRAIVRKYPAQEPQRVLRDLVARTPGQEGKWFAAAKEAGLLEMAIGLANQSPCDPKTLTRAARDFIEQNPVFALEAGLAALRWLGEGFGYEVSGVDVWAAYSHTINAAERVGRCDEVRERVRILVTGHRFLVEVLGRDLGLTGKAVP